MEIRSKFTRHSSRTCPHHTCCCCCCWKSSGAARRGPAGCEQPALLRLTRLKRASGQLPPFRGRATPGEGRSPTPPRPGPECRAQAACRAPCREWQRRVPRQPRKPKFHAAGPACRTPRGEAPPCSRAMDKRPYTGTQRENKCQGQDEATLRCEPSTSASCGRETRVAEA